jgi:outer membrane biosynthesis protein TonB
MLPQSQPRKRRSASKMSLLISFVFHGIIVLLLIYFAAREGLLGKQMKKITVEMVKEKEPEKPKESEKPKEEPPKVEPPKMMEAPKIEAPKEIAQAPPSATAVVAPPVVAPPAADVPSFDFAGGKTVQSSSDPSQLYKGFVEYAFLSKWVRPENIADDNYIAEVEISVDSQGKISNPSWEKKSGDTRWDESVWAAVAATKSLDRVPPKSFPTRVLVRFDVQDATEAVFQ